MLRNIKKGLKNMLESNKPVLIGVGGIASSGKDTFVKIAKKILKERGYSAIRLAFADALKEELDPFTTKQYGISSWTNNIEEKKLIRRAMVSHGCIMRDIDPAYWINKLDEAIENIHFNEDVIFVSDCRFPNEVDWVHKKWGGWFVHIKKYNIKEWHPTISMESFKKNSSLYDLSPPVEIRTYDEAPNEEEAKNDPVCEKRADCRLEMENAIERELRLTGNKISVESLIDNSYLNGEILVCLKQCPLLMLE